MTPKEFERQVERLFGTIESSAAEIVWNKRIRDPDTGQSRQIDIEIKRLDGAIIHVECRHHREKQDVKWIEELIGRRCSLRVDSVMAVASNGFTRSAFEKARAHGIQTWSIVDLNANKVQALFNPPDLWFPVFREIEIRSTYHVDAQKREQVESELRSEVRQHWERDSRWLLDELLRMRDHGEVSPTRRLLQWQIDRPVLVGGNSVDRSVVVRADFGWEQTWPETHRCFRKGSSKEFSIEADIFLSGFANTHVELIFAKKEWRLTVDLSRMKFPKNAVIGSSMVIAHNRLPGRKITGRFRKPREYDTTFLMSYNVVSV